MALRWAVVMRGIKKPLVVLVASNMAEGLAMVVPAAMLPVVLASPVTESLVVGVVVPIPILVPLLNKALSAIHAVPFQRMVLPVAVPLGRLALLPAYKA